MELLRPKAAAELVGVTDRTLRKWAAAGKLTKHAARDGSPRYDRAELESLANVEADRKGPEETGPPDRNEPERTGTGPDFEALWKAALDREAALSHERAELRRQVDELQAQALKAAQERQRAADAYAQEHGEQREELGRLKAAEKERDRLIEQVEKLQLALNHEQQSVLRFTAAMPALPGPARPWWRWWAK